MTDSTEGRQFPIRYIASSVYIEQHLAELNTIRALRGHPPLRNPLPHELDVNGYLIPDPAEEEYKKQCRIARAIKEPLVGEALDEINAIRAQQRHKPVTPEQTVGCNYETLVFFAEPWRFREL